MWSFLLVEHEEHHDNFRSAGRAHAGTREIRRHLAALLDSSVVLEGPLPNRQIALSFEDCNYNLIPTHNIFNTLTMLKLVLEITEICLHSFQFKVLTRIKNKILGMTTYARGICYARESSLSSSRRGGEWNSVGNSLKHLEF